MDLDVPYFRNRKVGVFLALLFAIGSTYSQISDTKSSSRDRHELHTNVFNWVVLEALNVSYEYLANENWSYGLGLFYQFDTKDPRNKGIGNIEVEYRTYSVTPYIRRYFSQKYARGFFIEGFGMLNSGVRSIRMQSIGDESSASPGELVFVDEIKRYTRFTLGITFGGKFLLGRKGILLEVNFGTGIPGVIGQSPSGLGSVSRGGVSLGYRF